MLTLVLLLVAGGLATKTNPGVVVRVTQRGIDYANSIAQKTLNDELYTLRVPSQGGKDHGASWDLKDIEIKEVKPPKSELKLSTNVNGFQWDLSDLVIKIKADWKVKYKQGFVKLSKSGGIDLELKRISLSVGIGLGADSTGRPTLKSASCSAHIDGADLSFHGIGGLGKILDYFDGPLERAIKNAIRDMLCPTVSHLIDSTGNNVMKRLKVTVPVMPHVMLDYGLTDKPDINSHHLDLEDKGMFYWKDDKLSVPFSPQVIDKSEGTNDRMLYLWATDYVIDTFAYAVQKHDVFSMDYKLEDMKIIDKSYLQTSCVGAGPCMGTVFPTLAAKHADSHINKVTINVTSPPKTSILPDGIHTNVPALVNLFVENKDQPPIFVLSLKMTLNVTSQPKVADERVQANITSYSYTVEVSESKIGYVDTTLLKMVLDRVTENMLVPKLNEIGANGFDLPMTGCATFTNAKLKLSQGYLMVGTDIKYKSM